MYSLDVLIPENVFELLILPQVAGVGFVALIEGFNLHFKRTASGTNSNDPNKWQNLREETSVKRYPNRVTLCFKRV
jgi:hypothetical protein